VQDTAHHIVLKQ